MQNKLLKKWGMPVFRKTPNRIDLKDIGVTAAFIGAISVLLLIGSYVISRLASERAYRAKWQDYNDCGWA